MENIEPLNEEIQPEVQTLTFFTEGNTYAGGITKDKKKNLLMRYLVRPDKENDRLEAFMWTEDVCFECSGEKKTESFALTDEGIDEVKVWLKERYDELV